jgi:4-amino-4-deoxychorismate lyase
MYPLFETIRINAGKAANLLLHEERMKRSVLELYNLVLPAELDKIIQCPTDMTSGIVKCRVHYTNTIHSVTYEPYQPRLLRSLKLVIQDQIDYRYKFLDRNCFAELLAGIEEDDILIVKKGLITDTSFANIIFRDGSAWFTPRAPLLAGTKREQLLSIGFLAETEIRPADLHHFSEARIINAMLDPMDHPAIMISHIH